jgi:hypothetical protein
VKERGGVLVLVPGRYWVRHLRASENWTACARWLAYLRVMSTPDDGRYARECRICQRVDQGLAWATRLRGWVAAPAAIAICVAGVLALALVAALLAGRTESLAARITRECAEAARLLVTSQNTPEQYRAVREANVTRVCVQQRAERFIQGGGGRP